MKRITLKKVKNIFSRGFFNCEGKKITPPEVKYKFYNEETKQWEEGTYE